MLECPNLLATLAIETPAKSNNDACVCLKPCIEIIGTLTALQCLSNIPLIVELYIFSPYY